MAQHKVSSSLPRAACGMSSRQDSREAGREAASRAIDRLGGTAGALVVFGAACYDHERLLEGVSLVVPDVPMAGGSTAGEICGGNVHAESVVVIAFARNGLHAAAVLGRQVSGNPGAAASDMAAAMMAAGCSGKSSLLVFPDGMNGDSPSMLDALMERLGRDVEIVGGCPGDDERFSQTFQYCNGRVYQDAVSALVICHDRSDRTGIGVGSGFESIGNSFICTSSLGNIVREFDHVPALELYREFLGPELSMRMPGIFMEYPFGLIDEHASSEHDPCFQLRSGVAALEHDGSIIMTASIPEGSELTLTAGSRGDVIRGARMAAEQARRTLGGAEPELVIMFSCVGRKMVLGRRVREEVDAVRECLGRDVPVAGFYTYGEIGPVDKSDPERSSARYHNETVVLWVLGTQRDQ
ncbi:FIST C-terminal domain-containing protein [Prosthecochloris sp. N3]|uniref:FIST C-terminal domain-containing protein n=2 Tax=Prosthecochloris ethylica TaxID=2743976 RepID=A0ABR9XNM5_9CHLB|nr:FIST N-terminal domain-containing protein [Prosthecochloris ethylica]MBF0585730.1 FIST C-terminal domain-containing protein [Prosthecochloris ethylica]MBF0635640.1 FIST C-terminal domain-containing protein [Prosthecochloris ethylica]NUK46939.1 FIST C-terminal domain-containing protein [Prosthecochloris ethylica]